VTRICDAVTVPLPKLNFSFAKVILACQDSFNCRKVGKNVSRSDILVCVLIPYWSDFT
jgi:hypothetical protein